MPKANKLAVVFIALLFGYYEIYRWVPLGAWNGEFYWPVKNDQFYPDIMIGLLLLWMLFVTLATAGRWNVDRRISANALDWRPSLRLVDPLSPRDRFGA